MADGEKYISKRKLLKSVAGISTLTLGTNRIRESARAWPRPPGYGYGLWYPLEFTETDSKTSTTYRGDEYKNSLSTAVRAKEPIGYTVSEGDEEVTKYEIIVTISGTATARKTNDTSKSVDDQALHEIEVYDFTKDVWTRSDGGPDWQAGTGSNSSKTDYAEIDLVASGTALALSAFGSPLGLYLSSGMFLSDMTNYASKKVQDDSKIRRTWSLYSTGPTRSGFSESSSYLQIRVTLPPNEGETFKIRNWASTATEALPLNEMIISVASPSKDLTTGDTGQQLSAHRIDENNIRIDIDNRGIDGVYALDSVDTDLVNVEAVDNPSVPERVVQEVASINTESR